MSDYGPYDTYKQVYAGPDITAVEDASYPPSEFGYRDQQGRDHWARHRDAKLFQLHAALAESGVELGTLDQQIVAWLVRGDLPEWQVVIAWVRRAYAAGRRAGESDA